ncbi:MAG TPA: hypothetical protein V6C81_15025 [Planktothrix sp.]|jgi:hypothetical protein
MRNRFVASLTIASSLWFCQAAFANGAGNLSGITNYSMQQHQVTRGFPKSLQHANKLSKQTLSPVSEAHLTARTNTTTANGRAIIQSTLGGIKSKIDTTGERAYTAVNVISQPLASGPLAPKPAVLGSETYESGLNDPDSWVNRFNRHTLSGERTQSSDER